MWKMECEDALQLIPELKNSLRLIVSGKNDEEIDEGWKNLRELENNGLFEGQVDLSDARTIMRGILRGTIMNLRQVPKLMGYFAKYVKKKRTDESATMGEEADTVMNDYVAFVRMTAGKDASLLTALVETLRDNPVYRSAPGDNVAACRAIVASLAAFPMPAYQNGSINEFRSNVARIQDSLRTICKTSNGFANGDLITVCLETVYSAISDTDRRTEPGPGLVAILELVENRMIAQAVEWIMSESKNDAQLERSLEVLCGWIHQWLQIDRLYIWVMALLNRLESAKKYDILVRVTNAGYVKKLLRCVMLPMSGKRATLLVSIILCKHPTADVFHKNVKMIEFALTALKKQETEDARDCERSLVNVSKALVERFPGYEFYDVLENSFPLAPEMDKVAALRDETVWADDDERLSCPEINYEQPNDNGKVGLTNLGNTCYMNSVLQALVMTRQFSQEVMRYKTVAPNGENEGSTWVASAEEAASIMPKLQNLFALLTYSRRKSLSPTEILAASRPDYFTPGQQQDSSEFLCHLLDVLYEQEKSLSRRTAGSVEGSSGPSGKGKRSGEVTSPDRGVIKRWTTEEDLSEGISLERKTSQSLGDFPQPADDEEQIGHAQPEKPLSDCHSDSTDSGIQSVDGCPNHGDESAAAQSILVHRVFGGESKITYQCAQCDTSSHNTDRFRDLQLCFPEEIADNQEVSVQDLMNYYLTPEKLTGDNKYRCDTCTKLCDAQRIIKILRAPIHLVLTLKHFHYDPETRLRTKLRHKVTYNETIRLPVSQNAAVGFSPIAENYRLYAAVVHSGYSMDYGHYVTYARDSKQNWYRFNDSWVTRTSLEDFTALQPPDTPYILFYEKFDPNVVEDANDDGSVPELSGLCERVRDLVERDGRAYEDEMRRQTEKKRSQRASPGGRAITPSIRRHDNSDDENPPPSSCRGPIDIPASRFLY